MARITARTQFEVERKARRLLTASLAATLVLFFTCSLPSAFAADSSLALGNAAVRVGHYEEALRYFDAAAAEGADGALLAFNRGVALYRLDKLPAAETAFVRASAAPKLRARAFYNLGLVHKALGHRDQARGWFQQSLDDANASPNVREMARRALAELGKPTTHRVARVSPFDVPYPEHASDFFDVAVSTQIATDSNVYSSPKDPYVNLAAPGNPVVDPQPQSGTFVPVKLFAGAEWGRWEYSRFHARYAFDGDFYTDSQMSNANRYSHLFSLGNTYDRQTPYGRIYLSSSFEAGRYEESAFDRDDGSDQFVSGEDVSDRYRHTRIGPRGRFAHDIGPFRYGVTLSGFLSDYDKTVPVVDYSNTQVNAGIDVSYKLFPSTRIGLTFGGADRNYDTYPARELDGTRFTENPNLEFRYWSAGATLRQRIAPSVWLALDYQLTNREDQYLGYDDYRCNTIRAGLHMSAWKIVADFAYVHRDYDFPNAFAFDTPAGGEKTLTSSTAEFVAQRWLWRQLYLTADARFDLNESSDPRSEYESTQAAIGVKWIM